MHWEAKKRTFFKRKAIALLFQVLSLKILDHLPEEVGNRKEELCVKDDCADGTAVRQKSRGKGV